MYIAVLELLIRSIALTLSTLSTEASLLWKVSNAIEDVKNELIIMQSVLIDSDKKGAGSEGEKAWLATVTDIAYDVEDVIDKFMYQISRERIGGRSARFLCHTNYFPKNLWERHKTASKLQIIKNKIQAIPDIKRYVIDHNLAGSSSNYNHRPNLHHAETHLFLKEDELVGIKDKRILLMGPLMDGKPERTVISVVGMGGSGKTTLVANIYNNDDVKRHFDCYAWITVSQLYDTEDLLRSMIKEFDTSWKNSNQVYPEDLSSIEYRALSERLISYLEKKKYLLVIDDVWDTNLLDLLKAPLPDGCPGSRIIVTTRNEDVASYHFWGKIHIHRIELIEKEEAWILFCKKAFSSSPNGCCPPEYELLAQELVERCEGLPLAIVAFGSLMYSKNISQWNEIRNSLNWNLSNNPKLQGVNSILLLSFKDLSHHLKHCFLYCSFFPEDYMIRRKRLMKLWFAEGFIEQVEGSTPEEVAESYLEKLVFRNMLQVVRRNEFGRPKAFKMHDVMRDLALSISKKENFGVVRNGGEEMAECKARRISIYTNKELRSFFGVSKLRSFLVFNKLKTLPSGIEMLRVLDWAGAEIDELPNKVVNLFNLRYLNLKGTSIKELPKSISRLLNLQSLDISDTRIKALPRKIGKLKNLQYLIMHSHNRNSNDFRIVNGVQVPSKICRLTNLQSVSVIEARDDLIRQIRSMTQLTSLGISNVKAADETDLCDSIQGMTLLRHLLIMVTNEEETLRMDALSSPPRNLQSLVLVGKLENVPQWFSSLEKLTFLYLHWSRLEEDVLSQIAALPNLVRLSLNNAYSGNQMVFHTGFPKLTSLTIRNFPELNEIIIRESVMPKVQSLYIADCMELETVPKGIEYLENLQELILESVSMQLKNRINLGEGSVDFAKVQHIPKIYMR
ncbi:disease resistance protein RPM1-like [Castanea sativa]|uniref:disease resistance protein RPM1-like n=1 Tax=Castanea sativa TaxID=21020 RepID=UPI003F64D0BC